MVSEKKIEDVKKVAGELKKYPVIGLLDMFKLPSKQLQEMRDKLKGKAKIKMVRKSILKRAMEGVEKKGIKELEMKIQNQPALLFSDADPFELARIIESSKSFGSAKEGDIAPKDIVVKAGKTNLRAGPVIGELQRIKIPAGVEGENIVIKEDAVVAKEGEIIEKNVADVLMKLGVEPIEISLNLLAVWDQGVVYPKDILFIPLERYENDIRLAYQNAFNLSINMGFLTRETFPLLLSKAYREAMGLAGEIGLVTKETVGGLIAKAHSQMLALKEKTPETHELSEGKEAGPEKKVEEEKHADKKSESKKEG
ncbi:MAG: 50S ribosomal protein L10 [Candidatus Aenigmarchaeota archaeon]|nr:50S ribosomal protein L10 [Candidatus Aenigmarchaeota archaeon]NIP39942.1 50S ribosomal protein L10 [Candidatus Aenigmarchaeota archaeon]NIQ17661.1 50S ribosomal protein L10 [Candidatus Aenigmarchaeota archaeon]NIS72849.1 50S ribosomal protein L10 [Candidatus Aenigmarchaeota archaeon]